MSRLSPRAIDIIEPILAVIVGLGVGLMVTFVGGENPLHVLQILLKSAFGSPYDFGMTLFYTTPLIFTGLAVALPFQAGLFNIGAEGQLMVGAMAATTLGLLLPGLPAPIAPMAAGFAAFLGGAFWAAIAGWLRSRRGAHEVITTIMLNFIAAGLTSYLTLYVFRNFEVQNPESRPLAAQYLLHHFEFFGRAPASAALLLALLAAGAVWFLISRTVLGYRIRAVGQSETVSRSNGIDAGSMRFWAITLAGGIAGLVGVAEVLGNAGKFKMEFSPGYGFIGIAVALLGRGHPVGVVFSALLFGALHKGAADLDLETESVTRDVSSILQACVILSVSSRGLWDWLRRRKVAPAVSSAPAGAPVSAAGGAPTHAPTLAQKTQNVTGKQ